MIWLDTIVQGVLLGGLYALFAAGLSLVFGIMRLVNLAHGDLIVAAAYLILVLVSLLGLSPFRRRAHRGAGDVRCGMGASAPFLLNRTLGSDILPPLLVTFGLSIALQNALLEGFSADSQRLPTGAISTASIELGALTIGVLPLLTFVSAIVVIVALNQLFYRTELGRAFRATSDDAVTASLMGIRPGAIFATATAIAMLVVTIAALYLGMRANFDPSIGPARLIYAFEAVIIGGLGSLWGTLAGGVIIGVAQTVGAAIDPEWQILSGHIAFLIVLLMCGPAGLFPQGQSTDEGNLTQTPAYRVSDLRHRASRSRRGHRCCSSFVVGLAALPFFAGPQPDPRPVLHPHDADVLAQFWNLLAGYGGMVSASVSRPLWGWGPTPCSAA